MSEPTLGLWASLYKALSGRGVRRPDGRLLRRSLSVASTKPSVGEGQTRQRRRLLSHPLSLYEVLSGRVRRRSSSTRTLRRGLYEALSGRGCDEIKTGKTDPLTAVPLQSSLWERGVTRALRLGGSHGGASTKPSRGEGYDSAGLRQSPRSSRRLYEALSGRGVRQPLRRGGARRGLCLYEALSGRGVRPVARFVRSEQALSASSRALSHLESATSPSLHRGREPNAPDSSASTVASAPRPLENHWTAHYSIVKGRRACWTRDAIVRLASYQGYNTSRRRGASCGAPCDPAYTGEPHLPRRHRRGDYARRSRTASVAHGCALLSRR